MSHVLILIREISLSCRKYYDWTTVNKVDTNVIKRYYRVQKLNKKTQEFQTNLHSDDPVYY